MKTFKIACNCAPLSSCDEMVTLVLRALFFLFFTGCLVLLLKIYFFENFLEFYSFSQKLLPPKQNIEMLLCTTFLMSEYDSYYIQKSNL